MQNNHIERLNKHMEQISYKETQHENREKQNIQNS